jgi:hypothetical protein
LVGGTRKRFKLAPQRSSYRLDGIRLKAASETASITQIKPNAKPMCYFIRSTLKADQVARCSYNSGLPTIGVVLANRHFHAARADHIGKLRRTDGLLTHSEAIGEKRPQKIRPRKSSMIRKDIWLIREPAK